MLPFIDLFRRDIMNLQKRDCPLEIELIPQGAGWTYLYLTTGGERLFFKISNVMEDQFSDLVRILYFFTPKQDEPGFGNDDIDYQPHAYDIKTGKVTAFLDDESPRGVCIDIPCRAQFTWDEEPSFSRWVLEREPDDNPDFVVKVHIEHHRHDGLHEYDFQFHYKDLCYAVAKAYTKVLREFGFWGYHVSTYHESICVHHLLFLKAVALDCLEIRNWTPHPSGHGEVTRIEDELELLMFDM
jgi:hypothetical protein